MNSSFKNPSQLANNVPIDNTTNIHQDSDDITRQNQERFNALYSRIPAMMYSIDGNGIIVSVTDHWLLKLGYTRQEVIGRKLTEFLTEESRQYAIETVMPAFKETGEIADIHYRFLKKNGEIMDGLVSSTSENDAKGTIIRTLAVITDITERTNAEQEKNLFLKLSLDMAGIAGIDGYFRSINPAVEWILGYTQEEFLLKPFLDFVHPDDVAVTLHEIEKLSMGIPTISFTNRYKCKDGRYKWLEWNTAPLGETLYAIARDATEWKHAQEALLISENQFKGAFQYSAIGMALVCPYGRWKEVNDEFCNIVGYTREELMKLTFQEITHPADLDADLHFLRELEEGKRHSYTMEKRYFHKNGTIVWVLLSVSMATDKDGKIVHFISQIQDITKWKEANQQVREQAALLDIVPDAIMMRDLDDKFIFWNRGAERMYGITSEEAIGKTPLSFRGEEKQEEFTTAKKILLEHGEWTGEFWHKLKTGSQILVQSRWLLIRDANDKPASILVTNTDITERRSLERQLLRSQRLESIGTLASGIAHDLNNLLTPVVLGMELLKMQLHDEQSRQRINSLVSTVQRGSGLIQQLLSFAKGKDGNHEALNVKYIIDEAVKFVRETFPRNIEVQVNISKEDLMITGDATQVNQIFMNLLINSRDAMEDHGGILSIEARRVIADELLLRRYMDAVPGQYVAITIRDTGTGIPHELQTILSRCQQINCDPLTDDEVTNALVVLKQIPPEEARLVASFAQGSFSKALEFLDEDMRQLRQDVVDLLRTALKPRGYRSELLHKLENFTGEKDRTRVEMMLTLLMMWVRDAYSLAMTNNSTYLVNGDQQETLERFTSRFGKTDFPGVLKAIEEAIMHIRRNVHIHLALLTLCISCRRYFLGRSV